MKSGQVAKYMNFISLWITTVVIPVGPQWTGATKAASIEKLLKFDYKLAQTDDRDYPLQNIISP